MTHHDTVFEAGAVRVTVRTKPIEGFEQAFTHTVHVEDPATAAYHVFVLTDAQLTVLHEGLGRAMTLREDLKTA